MKPDIAMPAGDWTSGAPTILVQACRSCSHVWYFRRPFCPVCGDSEPALQSASGTGTVYAVTTVERAPSAQWQEHAPYLIALIDLGEGVRVMGHGDPMLAIGDRVMVQFRRFGDALVPYFASTQ